MKQGFKNASLLTIKCLDLIDVSQDNRFRSSSYNAKDKATILTILSSKKFEKLSWKYWLKNLLSKKLLNLECLIKW